MSKAAFDPVSVLYQFPYFQTRADYEKATGKTCPPFSPSGKPKGWFDPNPQATGLTDASGNDLAMYTVIDDKSIGTATIAGGVKTKKFLLTVDDAAVVNIPDKSAGATNIPGADVPEVPVPLKDLSPTQVLVRQSPFAMGASVRNTDVPLDTPATAPSSFTDADRALLQAIADKVAKIAV